MTITIRIQTDNAAFEPDRDVEIARILQRWINGYGFDLGVYPLRDVNGNTCGTITVKGR